MTGQDTPAALVARFLRSNNYPETLEAFLAEANLPPRTGDQSSEEDELTIESILQEKRTFDLSYDFEKTGLRGGEKGWALPAPKHPNVLDLPQPPSNILHTAVHTLTLPSRPPSAYILSTTPTAIHLHSPNIPCPPLPPDLIPANDSPTLSTISHANRYLLMGTMSGALTCFDTLSNRLTSTRRDHAKFIVKVLGHDNPRDKTITVATAAWDSKICIYHCSLDESSALSLNAPATVITLPTLPLDILFLTHMADATSRPPVLVCVRRDSSSLHYYARGTGRHLGSQNLAPHSSSSWHAFGPAALAQHPSDPGVVAVATTHTPHMRVVVARLLVPEAALAGRGSSHGGASSHTSAPETQSPASKRKREESAIQQHTNTLAPQTSYSTPQVAWRPDGGGVWVNGDDGVVRGVDVGGVDGEKVMLKLEGHDAGCKVRCLWAGRIAGDGEARGEEVLISGGFDKKLLVWGCDDGG